jgi:hypothetical protein
MKKIAIILFLAVLGINANAQNGEWASQAMSGYTAALAAKSLDTASNTDTTYLYFTANGAAYNMHFKVTYTRISGTAGGTMQLQGSDDNFASQADTLSNVVAGINTSQYADAPTFSSLSSGSSTKHFYIVGTTPYKFKYYRVRLITSGTQTGSFAGTAYYRKP